VRVDADAEAGEVEARVRAALAARFPRTFGGTGVIS
jgi:hypothetical protein